MPSIRNIWHGKSNSSIKPAGFFKSFIILVLLAPLSAHSVEETTIEFNNGEYELTASCFLADDQDVIMQLPTIYAAEEDQLIFARDLAQQGQSTCLMHIFSDLFLPPENSNYSKLPLDGIWNLIAETHKKTSRSVLLTSHGRGAKVAIRTLQQAPSNQNISSGLIMFSPNLLDGAPDAGMEHQYIEETRTKTIPVYIFQPIYSPHYWHMKNLKAQFDLAGTAVHFHKLDDVRDGYPLREDQTDKELTLRKQTGKLLHNAIKTLNLK